VARIGAWGQAWGKNAGLDMGGTGDARTEVHMKRGAGAQDISDMDVRYEHGATVLEGRPQSGHRVLTKSTLTGC
jgi:hypothetical protein